MVRGQKNSILYHEYGQVLNQLFEYLDESLQDIDSVLYEDVLAEQFAKERDGYQVISKINPVIGKHPNV